MKITLSRLTLRLKMLSAVVGGSIIGVALGAAAFRMFTSAPPVLLFGAAAAISAFASAALSLLILGRSIGDFESMRLAFAAAVAEIYSEAQRISSVSVRLSATISQSASLEASATALSQIVTAVNKSAESAVDARELSDRSLAAASLGKTVAGEARDAIESINVGASALIDQAHKDQLGLAEIGGFIEKIAAKTQVIHSIVFQTRMLSFNASVEAARAGESGAGFAVVADEVGKLALMSGKAAAEISLLLDDSRARAAAIVAESKSTVEGLVTSNQKKVAAGESKARQCVKALDDIAEDVGRLGLLIASISAATDQQSRALQDVNGEMANMGTVTSANSEVAAETSTASKLLAKQAAALNGMVDQFVVAVNGKSRPQIGARSMIQKLSALGEPSLGAPIDVNGRAIPDLRFGLTSVAGNFDAVDEIKRELGGAATLFARSGLEFIRVSTNVMNEDGSRAIGTALSRNAAYDALIRGEPYCGELEILGRAFETCYEPIVAGGQTIGVYYFGNKS